MKVKKTIEVIVCDLCGNELRWEYECRCEICGEKFCDKCVTSLCRKFACKTCIKIKGLKNLLGEQEREWSDLYKKQVDELYQLEERQKSEISGLVKKQIKKG